MTRDELEQLLQYDSKENDWIFMPNEIFVDLPKEFDGVSSTLAFAYSFYYLISYLYYFTKYSSEKKYDVGTLKEILRYSSSYKPLNEIIKKNGKLDQIGYTESTNDYPIDRVWGDFDIDQMLLPYELRSNHELTFVTVDNLADETKTCFYREYGRPLKIKKPLKGFYRECDEYEGVGTFYRFEHTTRIPVEVFLRCMTNENLGTIGFYLYSWLKYKCEYYGGKFDAPLWYIVDFSGIRQTTATKYFKALEHNNMITVEHPKFDPSVPEDQRKAKTYSVNEWRKFVDVKVGV